MRLNWHCFVKFFVPSMILILFLGINNYSKDIIANMSYSLAVISLLLVRVYYNKRYLDQRQAKLIKQILVKQRHDLANHIQVLLAHLTLNKPGATREYLEGLSRNILHQVALTNINHRFLSTELLTAPLLFERCNLKIEVNQELSLDSIDGDLWYNAWRQLYLFIKSTAAFYTVIKIEILPNEQDVKIEVRVDAPILLEETERLRCALGRYQLKLRVFRDLLGFVITQR